MERFKIIYFLVFALILSACGSAPIKEPADYTLLAQDHGLVSIHYPKGKVFIEVKSVQDDKTYMIGEHVPGLLDISGNANVWLPAGEYSFNKVKGFKMKGYSNFTVEPGRVTNLGSFINFHIGEHKYLWLPMHLDGQNTHLNDARARFGQYLSSNSPITWKQAELPEAVKEGSGSTNLGLIADLLMAYDHHLKKGDLKQKLTETKSVDEFFDLAIRLLPPTVNKHKFYTNTPGKDEKGNLYYASELGTLKKRSADGLWSTIRTNSTHRLSAVSYYRGTLYVGNEVGEVLSSRDQGQTWTKEFKFKDDVEKVLEFDFVNDDLILLSELKWVKDNNKVQHASRVYRAPINDLRSLSQIQEVTYPQFYSPKSRGFVHDGTYYLKQLPDKIYSLDIASNEWNVLSTPWKFHQLHIDEKTGFLTAMKIQGVFSKVYLSADKGQSWTNVKAPSLAIQDIQFSTPDAGTALRLKPRAFTTDFFIHKYSATQNNWEEKMMAPNECKFMMASPDQFFPYCITKSDTILSFDGKEWKPEMYQ